ncbi:twin-arginine translocation signal domain-containing protein [Bacteroides uniformis]
MKTNDRRDFLKKSVLAGASLFAAPSFLSTASNKEGAYFLYQELTWEIP